jgi:hypothetical protein
MKISVVIVIIFMAGCAGVTPQESLEGIDLNAKDQSCVRECSRTYSSCISNVSGVNRLVANDVIRACGGALRICSSTCPTR